MMRAVTAMNDGPGREPFRLQQVQDGRLVCDKSLPQFPCKATGGSFVAESTASASQHDAQRAGMFQYLRRVQISPRSTC